MNTYDCIIIGGGIAGLTASIYVRRASLSVLVIEKSQLGGQIVNTLDISNYPGYKSISGYDLIENIKEQAIGLGVEIVDDEVIDLRESTLTTKTCEYNFKTCIIASGLKRRVLGMEEKYIGKGASYCATCDGAFFKDKNVAVVGGGNTALEDALYLSNIATSVYLIHRRDEFRGDNSTLEKVKSTNNIKMILNRQVSSLMGDDKLTGVCLDNGDEISVDGLFVAIGLIPDTKMLNNLIKCDEAGFVISDDTKTNIPNIFVAGDVRTKSVRQLITAASDGAVSAQNSINFINS